MYRICTKLTAYTGYSDVAVKAFCRFEETPKNSKLFGHITMEKKQL